MRSTRKVQWLKHTLGGDGHALRPSRVGIFSLERGELCAEYDVEPAGPNAVFSVHTNAP